MKFFDVLKPSFLLHLEGAAVLVGSLLFYGMYGGNWWLFALLLFVPDLSWLGYLAGNRIGASIYNLFHNYALPILLLLAGFLAKDMLLLQVALIWISHIGLDRLMGYGLKYSTEFKDTHFQHI